MPFKPPNSFISLFRTLLDFSTTQFGHNLQLAPNSFACLSPAFPFSNQNLNGRQVETDDRDIGQNLNQTEVEEYAEIINATTLCQEHIQIANVSKSASDIDEIAQVVAQSQFLNLAMLPPKVLLVIFENLESQYRQVLLGLTCARLYRVLKTLYPNPICPAMDLVFAKTEKSGSTASNTTLATF
ncbi:hypothetical protein IFR05_004575 [Cadophora sp. M221]|nr:hypothetical protein IFR05_004575 [Cadophora sp. M221]